MLNEEAVTNNDHLTLEWEEFWAEINNKQKNGIGSLIPRS